MRSTIAFLLASMMVMAGCGSDPTGSDPGPPAWLDDPLILPDAFEGEALGSVTLVQLTQTNLVDVYAGGTHAQQFVYGDGHIQGSIVGYATDFEAQDGHEKAKARLWGMLPIPSDVGDISTLSDYDTHFFYENDEPFLFFFVRNFTVFLKVDPLGQHPAIGLRKGVSFANEIFRANGRYGTEPAPPVELEITSISPTQGTALGLGAQVTVTVTVSYTLGIDPEGTVRLTMDPQSSLAYREKDVTVAKGTGTVTLSQTFALPGELPPNASGASVMVYLIPRGAFVGGQIPGSGTASTGNPALRIVTYSVQ